MEDNKLRRGWRRAADWLGSHAARLGWALVALLIGLMIGWWTGSFTTACLPTECEANANAIEAAGTWVGGLGTVAAVLFAANAFRSEERARRQRDAEKNEESLRAAELTRQLEQRNLSEAQEVMLKSETTSSNGDQLKSATMCVHNTSNATPIHKVKVYREGAGLVLDHHTVGPGKQSGTFTVAPDSPGQTVDGLRSKVTVEFEMNGQAWRRVGDEPAEKDDRLRRDQPPRRHQTG